MKTVNQMFGNLTSAACKGQTKAVSRMSLQLALVAMCSVLVLPGIAMAKRSVASSVGCVVFAPAYIDTGYPFKLKIVRKPAYPGVWSQPMVNADAVLTRTDGGKVTASYSETSSRYGYGVTYVFATLLAPSCNGTPCEIDTTVDAVITAVVKEPLNGGRQFRETTCTPATASINPSM
jgi:hypothetical protein